MKRNTNIKAGALQFVLFIGAIIAVLLLTFVLITYTHTLFHKKTDLTVSVIKQTDQGLVRSLEKGATTTVLSPLKEEGTAISVTVSKAYWGVFEKRMSVGTYKKTSFTKMALIGKKREEQISALYLSDQKRPLVLAGNAKITGDALLPQKGLRMGNIAGNSYGHATLLFGRQGQSGANLPKLDEEVLQQIKTYTQGNLGTEGALVTLKPGEAIKNSFLQPAQYIHGDHIVLEGMELTGNIMILASQKITVPPSARLRDVLLIAPEIEIKDGTQGYFQALANERITLGSNCKLAYPSALVVHKTFRAGTDPDPRPHILIGPRSEIRGAIVYLEENGEQGHSPQIKIEENTVVMGEVYCTQNLEHKGTAFGTITTRAFIALENGSIYQNHLYNGTINSTILPTAYGGLLVNDGPSKKVMKWLY
ncbi:MAG: hypothetical protein AAFZ89_01745 [Bacteroidota bacterium]